MEKIVVVSVLTKPRGEEICGERLADALESHWFPTRKEAENWVATSITNALAVELGADRAEEVERAHRKGDYSLRYLNHIDCLVYPFNGGDIGILELTDICKMPDMLYRIQELPAPGLHRKEVNQ